MAIENGVGLANENAGTVYHGRTLRRLADKMLMGWDVRAAGGLATTGIANGGIARSGDYLVAQRGAGANMSVDIATGASMVGGTESSTQGEYFVFNDATVNVVISAADATNARIDVIGLQVRDKEYSGANDDARLVVVTGTPSGAPAVPTLPADFLSLAHVAVAALAASIVTANITDKRTRLSALGGVIPTTTANRPATNLWAGQVIFDTTLNKALAWNGSVWQHVGPAAVFTSVVAAGAALSAVAFADLGLSVAITPLNTSSQIRLTAVIAFGNDSDVVSFNLMRGASLIAQSTGTTNASTGTQRGTTNNLLVYQQIIDWIDTPASASAQTYKIQYKVRAGSIYLNRRAIDALDQGAVTTMIAQEC